MASTGAMEFFAFLVTLALALVICDCQSTNDLVNVASAQDIQEVLGKKYSHVDVHSLTFLERKQLRYMRNIVSRKSAECNELRRDVKIAKKHLLFRTTLYKESRQDIQNFERCLKETSWLDSRCREISFYKSNKNICEQSFCGDGDKLERLVKERDHMMKSATKELNQKVNEYKMRAGEIRMTKQRSKELLERTRVKPSNKPRYMR